MKKIINMKNRRKRLETATNKNIVITGDSILNGLNGQGLKKKHNVKVSSATSLDIKDHVKPILRRKPDFVVLHCSTNDLTRKDGPNTTDTIEEIISDAKEQSPHTKILISTLTTRRYHEGMSKKVESMNKSSKELAKELGVLIINNDNVDVSCLSPRRLHLNKKGVSTIAGNFINFFDSI